MEENELRIGLWVYLFGEAVQLTAEHMLYLLPKNSMPLPVTLNEDWLLRFGFEKVRNGLKLKAFEGYVYIGVLFTGNPLTLEISGNRMPLHHVKYVHQLQNLYFALTGQELVYEPRRNIHQ